MAEILLALDVETPERAVALVDRLPDLRWVKVGPVLFVKDGPRLVRWLVERGLRVFLDLKWHDIPNTVARAVEGAAQLGVHLASVHALGGREMLEAAVAARGSMRLAAVSVLTSHSPRSYGLALGRDGEPDIGREVLRLSETALATGVDAVVASASEAAVLRARIPADRWIVVPGIRLPGAEPDDQRRTAEPREAVAAGATHLVVGRPVLRAENPRQVYDRLCEAVR
ncbi:MAG: orotidine-5'-phosphate decarboxylase [Gemmatimonadales bacterium]